MPGRMYALRYKTLQSLSADRMMMRVARSRNIFCRQGIPMPGGTYVLRYKAV